MSKIKAILTYTVYGCLLVFCAVWYVKVIGPNRAKKMELKAQYDELHAANENMQREVDELSRKQSDLQNVSEYGEYIARLQGYIKPGEEVFDFSGR